MPQVGVLVAQSDYSEYNMPLVPATSRLRTKRMHKHVLFYYKYGALEAEKSEIKCRAVRLNTNLYKFCRSGIRFN